MSLQTSVKRDVGERDGNRTSDRNKDGETERCRQYEREIRGDVRKEIRKDEDRVSGSWRTLSESIVEWKNGERKLGYELHNAAWLFLI